MSAHCARRTWLGWLVVAACATPPVDLDAGAARDGASPADQGTGADLGPGQDAAGAGDARAGSDGSAHDASARPDTSGAGDATAAADASSGADAAVVTYGDVYEGGEFHLGPVDYEETVWHNACAPGGGYLPAIQEVQGRLLAGLWNGVSDVAGLCDACIHVVTAAGKSAVLRVVTYGVTTANSIDVSPEAYALLDSGEYPRHMRWQLARCPDSGPILYEFQTASSEWWTSLWVRNARVPLARVEVQSADHANFVELVRGSDGTLTDSSGFGAGAFTLRLTGVDGQVVSDTFAWPAAGLGGALLTGHGNFD
jgi:expansin (peptidoglycan-binding protein)